MISGMRRHSLYGKRKVTTFLPQWKRYLLVLFEFWRWHITLSLILLQVTYHKIPKAEGSLSDLGWSTHTLILGLCDSETQLYKRFSSYISMLCGICHMLQKKIEVQSSRKKKKQNYSSYKKELLVCSFFLVETECLTMECQVAIKLELSI